MNLAVAHARIHSEAGLVGQAQLNGTVAIINLYVADSAHRHLDCAIIVLQTHIAGNAVQADILGPCRQV